MKWIELDLRRIVEIERQVDEVCRTYDMLKQQLSRQHRTPTANPAQLSKALELLTKSIVDRVAAMDQFYHAHDVEPGAARLEANRVKLKRLLLSASSHAPLPSAAATPPPSGGAAVADRQPERLAKRDDEVPSPSLTFSPIAAHSSRATPPPLGMASAIDSIPAGPAVEVDNNDEKVLVRIIFTQAEFDELLLRREAIQQMLGSSAASRGETDSRRRRGVRPL